MLCHAPFLFALLMRSACSEETAAMAPDHVVDLNTGSWEDFLAASDGVLVDFFSPMCWHCRQFEPEFRQTSVNVRAAGLQTALAMVDVTQERVLAKRYAINSFPTVKYFIRGRDPIEYAGERNAKSLESWLRRLEDARLAELAPHEVAAFLDRSRETGSCAVLAKMKKGSQRFRAFKRALEGPLQDFDTPLRYGVVWLPESADKKKDAFLSMWCFVTDAIEHEDSRLAEHFAGQWTEAHIATWIRHQSYPVVGTSFSRTLHSAEAAAQAGFQGSIILLLGNSSSLEDTALKQKVLSDLAEFVHKSPRWKACLQDVASSTPEILKLFGADSSSAPLLSVLWGKRKFLLQGPEALLKSNAVGSFVAEVEAGLVKGVFLSADKPSQQVDSEGVAVLVGSTFEDVVLDPRQDVLVMFYAPWCSHCKKLAPDWSKLASKSRSWGWDVLVAKMDATENESDEEVTGYPKIVLYPAVSGKNKMRKKTVYKGAWTFEALADFLLANAINLQTVEELGPAEQNCGTNAARCLAGQKPKRKNL